MISSRPLIGQPFFPTKLPKGGGATKLLSAPFWRKTKILVLLSAAVNRFGVSRMKICRRKILKKNQKQSFYPILHNCFRPPFLFVEGLLSLGPFPSSFCLFVEMGLPLHLFPAYMLFELDQLFLQRHHHKDFKWTKLCLGPIQFRGIFGLPGKTKKKAYKTDCCNVLSDCWYEVCIAI